MRKTIGERFEEMSRLYHFTSAKAVFSIIESGRLRFGQSFRLNDLIESNRIVFKHLLHGGDACRDEKDALTEDEMRRYQVISFAQDRHFKEQSFLGFDLHTMWVFMQTKGMVCALYLTRISWTCWIRIGEMMFSTMTLSCKTLSSLIRVVWV